MPVLAWKWEPTIHVLVQMGILDETVRLTLTLMTVAQPHARMMELAQTKLMGSLVSVGMDMMEIHVRMILMNVLPSVGCVKMVAPALIHLEHSFVTALSISPVELATSSPAHVTRILAPMEHAAYREA